MDGSLTPIERILKFHANRYKEFPYQEMPLTYLCMHMQGRLLKDRNEMLKVRGTNETLFMALITLELQENRNI